MTMNWTKNYERYKGLWVALKSDQKTVVSSGKTVDETVEKAKKKGLKNPILFKVPTSIIPYVGIISNEV